MHRNKLNLHVFKFLTKSSMKGACKYGFKKLLSNGNKSVFSKVNIKKMRVL